MAGLVIITAVAIIIIILSISPSRIHTSQATTINVDFSTEKWIEEDPIKLSRDFWSNSGLCPPAPINESSAFYSSGDLLLNLQIIGSLPNRGLSHIRPHWIFQLVEPPFTNFTRLVHFIQHLRSSNLYPTIEFMDDRIESERWDTFIENWFKRITTDFGRKDVSQWYFETWNEPDLKSYNLEHWNGSQYHNYLKQVRESVNLTMGRYDLMNCIFFVVRFPN